MERKSIDLRIVVAFGMVLLLFVVAMAFGQLTSAEGDLPPRDAGVPTATPVPEELVESNASFLPEGGTIEMEAAFSDNWPWDSMMWQDLWLEVEWADGDTWYKVDGWRGNFDSIDQEDDVWTGHKAWWVAQHDLGKGPFRWVVYTHEDGDVLATSENFDLPTDRGQMTMVPVELAP